MPCMLAGFAGFERGREVLNQIVRSSISVPSVSRFFKTTRSDNSDSTRYHTPFGLYTLPAKDMDAPR